MLYAFREMLYIRFFKDFFKFCRTFIVGVVYPNIVYGFTVIG